MANASPPSPVAPFSAALQRPGRGGAGAVSRRQLPQAIAHRGYKMAYPENSMAAFRSAVEIGAHAIETDLHLSRDGVVVLSHVRARLSFFSSFPPCSGLDAAMLWGYREANKTTSQLG